jgi:hypothetical protein
MLRLTSGRVRLKTERSRVLQQWSYYKPCQKYRQKKNTVRVLLSTADILSAVHPYLTYMCHETRENRVSANFVQVKNGWSYTSVPPIRLHGVGTQLL